MNRETPGSGFCFWCTISAMRTSGVRTSLWLVSRVESPKPLAIKPRIKQAGDISDLIEAKAKLDAEPKK